MNNRQEVTGTFAGIAITSILLIIFCFLYIFIVQKNISYEKQDLSVVQDLTLVGTIVLLAFIHELCHYVTFLFYLGWKKRKDIKLGVKLKLLAPYCHCAEILPVKQYRMAVIMPFVVTGIIPAFFFPFFYHPIFLVSLMASLTFCSGDIYILWKLLKYNKYYFVEDHPTKIGCIVYNQNPRL